MYNDLDLPENDRDRQLAQRVGALLDAGETLSSTDTDTLVAPLVAYKNERAAADTPSPEAAARMWAEIDAQTQPARSATPERPPLRRVHKARIYRLGTTRTWLAMAASIVILLGITWVLLTGTSDDLQLVASAGAEMTTYTAPDGSVVTLRPHSNLYAVALEDEHMQYRLDGEGYFVVTSNAARTFSVQGNEGLISVLGTQFNVSTWGNQTTVYLEEGRVRFEHIGSQGSTELVPGQRSTLTETGELITPITESNDDYLDWMRGEMTFDQRTLQQILSELGHHYAIAFDVADALLIETFSGRLDLSDQAISLQDLGNVMGGRFVESAPGTYRFE